MAISFPYIYKEKSSPLEIVTWADGTPAQLAAMLQAHDNGLIDIYDYWSVGDERTEHLSAIAANPNGAFTKAMDAQDVVMVLMNEGYMNQQGIHFAVGQKDCLNQKGRMNATNTNTGSWKDSLMRADLNNLYYNAFSADFRALFKPFNVTTAQVYNDDYLTETVQDYFSLFAEREILDYDNYSAPGEWNALLQIEYYKTQSNRMKYFNGSNTYWWERSIYRLYLYNFLAIHANGTAYSQAASNTNVAIAPFGCI